MKTVLIAGNTAAFSRTDILRAADRVRPTMISFGDHADSDKTNLEAIRYYHQGNVLGDLSYLFRAQQFAAVWYISDSVDGGRCNPLETSWIADLMGQCRRAGVGKFLLLTSLEGRRSNAPAASDDAVAALEIRQVEELAAEAAGGEVKLITLRLPRLASEGSSRTWLRSVFKELHTSKSIRLPYSPESRLDFIPAEEMFSLLCHITDEVSDGSAAYEAVSGYRMTCGDFARELEKAEPGAVVSFGEHTALYDWPDYPDGLRRAYGFVPMQNQLELMEACYLDYCESEKKGAAGTRGTRRLGLAALGRFLPVIELLLFFFIAEAASRVTSESVYFRLIDVRLAYVVLMGCVHGLRFGLGAAAAECVMTAVRYAGSGVSGTAVFYNISYWLPFVVYLAAGSISGYIENLRREKIQDQKKEMQLVEDKYSFLQYVYKESIANQEAYRNQIWSFKDSYGKIAGFVRELNRHGIREICTAAVGVLEKGMALKSVLIYRLDGAGASASLYCASRECAEEAAVVINGGEIAEYQLACKRAAVWKNVDFGDERPSCARIVDGGPGRHFLIMLRQVQPVNMNTWYVNQFRILCDLIEIFLQRAAAEDEAECS